MLLSAQNIRFAHPNKNPVFSQLSLNLNEKKIISIVGPSGAGKSTLMKCLAGHLQIASGQIIMEGESVLGPEEQLMHGHPEIALVNQLFELNPFFTVQENISNQLLHLTAKDRAELTEELLQIFELKELSSYKSKHLSGGEKQRLSMSCALAKEPKVLLLDEPFVHLDVHLNKSIGEYLKKLAEIRNMGVIIVTHNGEEALSWSDYIYFLHQGKITNKYTPKEAYYSPKNAFEGRFFGELNTFLIDGKEHLTRPTEYSLSPKKYRHKIALQWKYFIFKGGFYANYFNLENGIEVVLYNKEKMTEVETIYV